MARSAPVSKFGPLPSCASVADSLSGCNRYPWLPRAGIPVDLTALEFRLLSVFIRRRGRLLTRPQLLDAAWGADTFITDRVVDTHVLNLCKKIEPEPARPRFLASVRGMGYRFDG